MGDYLPTVNLGSTVQWIQVNDHHTCALLIDDSYKCWGDGREGQLGDGVSGFVGNLPNQMGNYLVSADLGTGFEITLCFDFTPTFSPTLRPTVTFAPTLYKESACSSRFSYRTFNCVLFSNQMIKCFGWNNWGQVTHTKYFFSFYCLPFFSFLSGIWWKFKERG